MNQIQQNPNDETDYIQKKYLRHSLHTILTMIFSIFLLMVDIKCMLDDEKFQAAFAYCQITFCSLIFFLAFQELRYYYRVKNKDFLGKYSDFINYQCFQFLLILIFLLYFGLQVHTIIFIYIPIFKGETPCNIYYLEYSLIYKLFFAVFCTIGQLMMIFIPIKISKTLKIIMKQKDSQLYKYFVGGEDLKKKNFDITASDGHFVPLIEEKQQFNENISAQNISVLKRNPVCLFCNSKIHKNQFVSLQTCGHVYHFQCFQKYYQIQIQNNQQLICRHCSQSLERTIPQQLRFEDLKQN